MIDDILDKQLDAKANMYILLKKQAINFLLDNIQHYWAILTGIMKEEKNVYKMG